MSNLKRFDRWWWNVFGVAEEGVAFSSLFGRSSGCCCCCLAFWLRCSKLMNQGAGGGRSVWNSRNGRAESVERFWIDYVKGSDKTLGRDGNYRSCSVSKTLKTGDSSSFWTRQRCQKHSNTKTRYSQRFATVYWQRKRVLNQLEIAPRSWHKVMRLFAVERSPNLVRRQRIK